MPPRPPPNELRVSFTLRALQAEDVDRVFELAAATPDGPRWTRRDYEQLLNLEPPGAMQIDLLFRFSVVALGDGHAVGFAAASWLREEPAAEVEALVVEVAHRRQGIGSALLGDCKAWAGHAGASLLRLEVRKSNAAALALYHRHGFAVAGVRRAYYSAPAEDALLLEAPLTPRPLQRIRPL